MKKLLFSFLILGVFIPKMQAQTDFYDQNTIQNIYITFPTSTWDYQMDTAKAGAEGYTLATQVVINGVTYDSVGVKYKGNSTYGATQVKNPLHISLDYIKGNQDYQGYTDVKLSNIKADPSMVREVLAYKILRNYMHAPKANFAKVYINGTWMGLYTNVESINKKFNLENYYSSDGAHFKCTPVGGAGPGGATSYPSLVLGSLTDSTTYYSAYEIKSDYGWGKLIHLMDTLKNQTGSIENILDVDRALWMLAFNDALVNLDSYTGTFTQNYYLYYDHNNRFNTTIWDLNMCFGGFSMLTGGGPTGSLDSAGMRNMSLYVNSTLTSRPLIYYLLQNATYKRMYTAHVKTIIEEMFDTNLFYTDGTDLQTLIDANVQADPNKFYSYAQFLGNMDYSIAGGGGPGGSSVPGIANLMNGRKQYLHTTTQFQAATPGINNILLSNNSPAYQDTVWVTAEMNSPTTAYLGYRYFIEDKFLKTTMFDDGQHQDGSAGDGVYGAMIIAASPLVQYYLYAENANAGIFSPVRAEHEFYSFSVSFAELAGESVVINELLASNTADQTDAAGEYDDWIELYNNTNNDIDMFGMYLSDKDTSVTLWAFPENSVIPAHGFMTIWADGDLTQADLHCDFKLSGSGETLYLRYATGTVMDSVTFGVQTADISYGRLPNGTGNFQTMPTTFGATNSDFTSVEVLETNHYTLYPNPASRYWQIASEREMTQVEIFNTLGQLVDSQSFAPVQQHIIDISQLTTGVYHVRINGERVIQAVKN